MPFIIFLVIIAIICVVIAIQNNKTKQESKADMDIVFARINELKEHYIAHMDVVDFKKHFKDLYQKYNTIVYKTNEIREFISFYDNIDNQRKLLNRKLIEKELLNKKHIFDDIDGKSLDRQQRLACIVNEDANLVVAGAGSGKTLTICGKVKYLLDMGIKPEQILCISFTNKVCDELKERLKNISGENIDVLTFHKLGLRFLKDTNKKFIIADENKTEQILEKAFYGATRKDLAIMELNALVVAENYIKEHSLNAEGQMITIKNVIDHVQKISKLKVYERDSIQLDTMCSEKVKSQHELEIANFLFLNGIKYEYERQYEFKDSKEFFQYKPDFYLPDYDIYIEHFGIDKTGKASWLKDENKIKQYSEEMEMKKSFHKKHKNKLICTYSYEKDDLLSGLYQKLSEMGVVFKPCSELVITMFNSVSDYENAIIKTTSSFIKLFKNRGYVLSKFDEFLNPNGEFKPNSYEIYLLKLIKAVYIEYQELMQKDNLIDFDDMILMANKSFKSNDFDCAYKYIIVDEYQDVSIGKVDLLKNIIDITDARLIAVGDDWQSIYRFAGSEVTLISNFKRYFKYSEIMKIEKTYRNSKEIITVSGGFVQKNENQIKKALISGKSVEYPIEIISYNEKTIYIPNVIEESERFSLIKESIKDGRFKPLLEILDKIENGDKKKVLLLVRNNDNYSIIRYWIKNKNSGLTYVENPLKQLMFKYKNVEVTCMTIHKSKGLESDNVILFDLREGYRGLPDTLGDQNILRFVIASIEPIEFAEDRRLFYVALTRTKERVYILNQLREQSRFIDEIIEFKDEVISDCEEYRCPLCNGFLVKIDQYGFYGCSNYLKSNCEYKIKAMNNEELVEKRKAISLWQNRKPTENVVAKIKTMYKQTAPKGNPCLKMELDLYFKDHILGDVIIYLNGNSGYKFEDIKLHEFMAAIEPSGNCYDNPFYYFNDLKEKALKTEFYIDVISNDYGQTFELNKNSYWWFRKSNNS